MTVGSGKWRLMDGKSWKGRQVKERHIFLGFLSTMHSPDTSSADTYIDLGHAATLTEGCIRGLTLR